ncbi:MAG: glycosyltransferase family 4 protein [Pseudomonadota bacterium]
MHSQPIIYYGIESIPTQREKASGGVVKLQDLQQKYSNNFIDANILYLVSSALPIYPKYLINNARKNKLKLVWNQNGVAYPAWHGPGWEKTNKPLADGLHLADHVIFQSLFCKLASDRFLGAFEGPHTILYNPVDTIRFSPSPSKPDGYKILIAGTHNEWYRVRVALESFKKFSERFPEAELIIGGPLRWSENVSVARSETEQYCRKLSIEEKVHYLGPYSQEDAVEMFRSAHVLLHMQYNDACPRLVVEAMACGLPIVFSSTGGTPELVGPDAGIGVTSVVDWERIHEPEPEKVAEALFEIFNDLNRYSKEARKRAVGQFGIKFWIDSHEKIFHSVLT